MSREQRIQLSQSEPSNRWIDPTLYPIATEYQSLLQSYDNFLVIQNSGISIEQFEEIREQLSNVEDEALQQARRGIQTLVRVHQFKLEAFARLSTNNNPWYTPNSIYSQQLPEVYQQNCELKEIDNDLFDVAILLHRYRI